MLWKLSQKIVNFYQNKLQYFANGCTFVQKNVLFINENV